jgi:hypothetical protein
MSEENKKYKKSPKNPLGEPLKITEEIHHILLKDVKKQTEDGDK